MLNSLTRFCLKKFFIDLHEIFPEQTDFSYFEGSLYGVMVNVPDCDIIVSKFK